MKFNISKGKKKAAIRTVIYGPEGIGKSTFASEFPEPLFIDVEGSTHQLDVARFDDQPNSWDELLEMIDAVIAEPDACKTLVIDTIDRAEMLLTNQLLKEGKCDSIEKYGGGYGKGYTALFERMQKDLLLRLDRVIAKGVNVTLVAHAMMRKFESPDDPPYDRWELKISKKCAPLVKEWCDNLFFANYEVLVTKDGTKNKARGNKRIMYCTHSATHDAKNRYGLDDDLPFDFEPLRAIYEGSVDTVPVKTEVTIDPPHEGIVESDEDLKEDVRDVLVKRLKQAKISKKTFEQWLILTERIQPGTGVDALSGSMAKSMLDNIDLLIGQIGAMNGAAK